MKNKLSKKYIKIVKLFDSIGCGSEFSNLDYCNGYSCCQNHRAVKQLKKLLKIKHSWEYNKGIKLGI